MIHRIIIASILLIFLSGCGYWTKKYNSTPDVTLILDVTEDAVAPLEIPLRKIAEENQFDYVKKTYAAAPEDYYSIMARSDMKAFATPVELGKFKVFFYENRRLTRGEVRNETLRVANDFAEALTKVEGVSNPKIKHFELENYGDISIEIEGNEN